MFRFTPRQLEIFLAVGRAQSFRQASENLRISQAAVSEQMRALEQQIGATLFHRRAGRSMRLTAEGERFQEGVKTFVQKGHELGRLFRGATPQKLRIFIGTFLLNEYVRPALPRFLMENADIALDFVHNASGADVDDQVARGILDCAIFSREQSDPQGGFEPIFAEPAFVFATRELRDQAKLRGLQSLPFISWNIPPLRTCDQLRMLASAGVMQPVLHSEVQHHEVAVELATQGAGAVIMLHSTVQRLDRQHRLVPIVKVGTWERRLFLSQSLDQGTRDRLALFFREVVGNGEARRG
ncbi:MULTISPECIES: LysR family transcriptional regulator [Sphingobium]|jgi:DNA-binding transcriptional LysR family regulator|uniref:LysR family transcriptional regulator n=1 Tax=Sphingobium fuliginis (strain ATCC 27551) TaxID=336203 RepID=A0A292ZLH3_SPHSA|nr:MULTISPECIES: LysR family transcriptional regulator [Sphingobium]AJR23861.1 LysR family transcriptional regulator [Sphingobium sp. YBL2]MCB4857977.1 LysR family transcriptional regulator [Sphingobium sp. PNB]QOT73599.1 LysR family transcriptional regulator [Sphingobium fuliginis]RYL97243.1 LysR family transcriptional regulator [Sphingobium fuliginis]WDA35657.1 LysR family transcriptional regulator [Sphingobium sp. YC-XJ3]